MDVDSPFRQPALPGCFTEMYRCQPASALPHSNPLRETLDYCGKIILPQSALEQISNYDIEYPMIFKLTNVQNGTSSHCGVLEFSAKEGVSYIPGWLMETLSLKAGEFIQISNTRLPSGKLIKIQPQSPDFLDITDPRAVLEFTLRQFTTLSPNDCFWINYADQIYKVKVLETEPDENGILVIETDLNVDFAPPVGYVEPEPKASASAASDQRKSIASSLGTSLKTIQIPINSGFVPFSGVGQSLRSTSSAVSSTKSGLESPAPTPTNTDNRPAVLNLPRNMMFFGVSSSEASATSSVDKTNDSTASSTSSQHNPQPFQGKGRSLR